MHHCHLSLPIAGSRGYRVLAEATEADVVSKTDWATTAAKVDAVVIVGSFIFDHDANGVAVVVLVAEGGGH